MDNNQTNLMLKKKLLEAPDGEMDQPLKDIIARWSDTKITALEILKALDNVVHYASASPFVHNLLNIMLSKTIDAEGITLNDLIPQATWRNEGN